MGPDTKRPQAATPAAGFGAYCHHGSLTPVFTLLPVTPPADNRCGTPRQIGAEVVPESHGKLRERHIAALL